jgi:hypothetical protein
MSSVPTVPSVPGTDEFTCSPLSKGNRERTAEHGGIRSRKRNTHTPVHEWKLKRYLRNEADEIDLGELSQAIERVSDVRSALITVQKHPMRPGARELLVERLAHLHRLVAALRRDPPPRTYGVGSSDGPPECGSRGTRDFASGSEQKVRSTQSVSR